MQRRPPPVFSTICQADQAKVSYVTVLLRGSTLDWAKAVLGSSGANCITCALYGGAK